MRHRLFLASLFVLLASGYLITVALSQNRWLVPAQILFFIVPSLFVLSVNDRLKMFRLNFERRLWLKLIVGTIFVVLFLNGLLWLVEQIPGVRENVSAGDFLHKGQPFGIFRDLFFVSIVTPFAEEMFFRGYLQTILLEKMRPAWAIVCSSLFFALYHMNFLYAPFLFVLGILFGVLVQKTKSLWPAIAAHAINNAIAIVFLYGLGG